MILPTDRLPSELLDALPPRHITTDALRRERAFRGRLGVLLEESAAKFAATQLDVLTHAYRLRARRPRRGRRR